MHSKENKQESLAIVGMACRFPGGANSPEAFWEMLCGGVDAIVDIPGTRWDLKRFYDPDPKMPGKMYVRQGGFLREDLEQFDPQAFGISPREAASVDPQQRLMLELSWEAMEDAGIPIESLAGKDVGVYVGCFTVDNKMTQLGVLNRSHIDSHTSTSSTMAILSNRVSYVFDLRGPSITMDTACSSSLVAFHQACQAIMNGDCTMAIVGGTNSMMRPEYPIAMSKGQFLAKDGRCKTFDASADGYGRGEGGGVLLLKPLKAAQEHGDRIYALVRGTAVNQDGHTPGITLPNQASQEALIRKVCQRAAVQPEDIQYVEAHGTGTQAGDLAETNALGSVLGGARPEGDTLLIGSVKTNIGHLEAAAGVAGLIKATLCLRHQQIPPNLHFNTPNPAIPFEKLRLRVPTTLEQWPEGRGKMACVNSFGYGGTNAHAILEGWTGNTKDDTAAEDEVRRNLFPLSAQSDNALRERARRLIEYLAPEGDGASDRLADLYFSLSQRSSHHDYRLAVIAEDRESLTSRLKMFLAGERDPEIIHGRIAGTSKPFFVFTGMGPQWWGMGRALYEQEPAFKEAVTRCDEIFKDVAGWSILDAMLAPEAASRMDQPEISQPANFVLQIGLTELLYHYGVQPTGVVGHSVGEVAAAYVSGSLSLRDAVTVSYHRSQLQQRLNGLGRMLAVGLSLEDAQGMIEGMEGLVSVAGINGPTGVVLAGEGVALEEIARVLEQQEIFQRMLNVGVAYHSYQMDVLKEDLHSALADIRPQPPRLPLYSTVAGARVEGVVHDAGYWWQNVRQPVRFEAAARAVLTDGYATLIEVGPHPVLAVYFKEIMNDMAIQARLFKTLHRKQDEHLTFLGSIAELFTHGHPLAWQRVGPSGQGRFVPLPKYPWQREQYFTESQASKLDRLPLLGHPLLGRQIAAPGFQWETGVNDQLHPSLKDHKVSGAILFPGAGYVEAALAMDKAVFDVRHSVIESIHFPQALVLQPSVEPKLHCVYDKQDNRFEVFSSVTDDGDKWTLHAAGTLLKGQIDVASESLDLGAIRERCHQETEARELYDQLAQRGLQYGPSFQSIERLLWRNGEVLAAIRAHEVVAGELDRYRMHPALLDACFQALIAGVDNSVAGKDAVFVPVEIERVEFYDSLPPRFLSHGNIVRQTENSIVGHLSLCDEQGRILAKVKGLRCQALPRAHQESGFEHWLYAFEWKKQTDSLPVNRPLAGNWLVLSDGHSAQPVIEYLRTHGADCVQACWGETDGSVVEGHHLIHPEQPWPVRELLKSIDSTQLRGVLYCGGGLDAIDQHGQADCVALLHLVQGLVDSGVSDTFGLCVLTQGGQALQDETAEPRGGSLWGLGRVIMTEHPELGCTLLDLDPRPHSSSMALLRQVLEAGGRADEWSIRQGSLYARRLDPVAQEDQAPPPPVVPDRNTAFELEIAHPGMVNSLQFREVIRRAPGQGEVEVKVHSAGLNFKDVMKAMGMLSSVVLSETFFRNALGLECSGVISRIGPRVSQFKVGDPVIAASASGCFKSHMTVSVDEAYIVPKPASLSMEEAPILIPYAAVLYGLRDAGRLSAGEKVLIHAATGGVGLAAIQYAKHVGAEIYATAGTPEKRDMLRGLGVPHVMDSRTLKFADQIMELTDGKGVDVVINSLSGEALRKSFDVLAAYGRFIEIGKRDIDENSPLYMRPFNRNVTFCAVDIDRMMAERRDLSYRLLHDICDLVTEGVFTGLPTQTFPASSVVDAFQHMARAKHVGKISVALQDAALTVEPAQQTFTPANKASSYLVSGGTSGFGLETAKWLASKGAGALVLASRRGSIEQADMDFIRAQGTEVHVVKADVSSKADVDALFEAMETLPPLKGVIHAAGVLDDALLPQMDAKSFERVMAPKAMGALHLHHKTRAMPLDFFVLYSSVSSLVGNAGQANYVAANAFLDSLAHYRHSIGLPGLSVNWGVLTEVGMAARSPDVLTHLQSQGIRGIPPAQALEALEHLLASKMVQAGVMDMDWERWGQMNPNGQSARYANLVEAGGGTSGQSEQLKEQLLGISADGRVAYLTNLVGEQIANILRLPQSKLDIHQPFNQLGIDSLMTVEIQTALQIAFGVSLSTMDLMKEASVAQLAKLLMQRLDLDAADDIDTLLDQVDSMDSDELHELLEELTETE